MLDLHPGTGSSNPFPSSEESGELPNRASEAGALPAGGSAVAMRRGDGRGRRKRFEESRAELDRLQGIGEGDRTPEAAERGIEKLTAVLSASRTFRYDAGADVYRCPAGAELRPMRGEKRQASGKMAIRYASRRAVCRECPLRACCLAGKGTRREIERWADEEWPNGTGPVCATPART
jgi:hypothetical protein